MTRLALLLIGALIVSVAPVTARSTEPAEPADQADRTDQEARSEASPTTGSEDDFEEMENLLRDEEAMIEGSYSYDAGRRRDPFVSLARKRNAPVARPQGECPTGCLIDEVTLTGIFLMPEGPVAQVQSPDQDKSFLIRVGDEFHDGDVVAITADSVRFRQMVNDFQEMKPFREVTKKLNP